MFSTSRFIDLEVIHMKNNTLHKLGIDIGSTTVKIAILDEDNQLLFSDYERHFANIRETLHSLVKKALDKISDCNISAVITGSGVNFGALMGGAVVTETLFSLPGIASFIVNGIKQKDVPVVMGGIIFFAIVFAFVMLLVDIIYAYVDPRIKAKYTGRRN